MTRRPRILIGVTVDRSLILLKGFPDHLARHGWDVHVVSAPGPRWDSLAARTRATMHALPMTRDPNPIADSMALAQWIRLIRSVRPDVVSVGTPKAALLGLIAAKLVRVPVRVSFLRGLRLETATGLQRRVLWLMERMTNAAATHVLAVSPSLRDKAVDLGVVRRSKIEVLGHGSSNGVDVEAVDAERSAGSADDGDLAARVAPDIPVIGFVGRLTPDKGLDVLADARALLEQRGVDHQMLIVGGVEGGTDGWRRVTATGRPAIVTGHVENVSPMYETMRVLCLPTFREGFPNVVLEAAAHGVPTVTTNATGAVDAVLDRATGLVVPVRDAEALADALQQVLEDEALAERLGTAARHRVESHFDRIDVWRRIEDFYRGAYDRTGPGR